WPTITILSCSVGVVDPFPLTIWTSIYRQISSHVSVAPQLLKRIFALLVLSPARSLRCAGMPQLLNDLAHAARIRLDRERARRTAQTPISFALLIRKVERNHRNLLPLDIFPHIQLRPVEQGMDPDVCSLLEISLELVPQLRWLIFHVPFHVFITRAEIAFLRACRLLIAPHAHDHPGEMMLIKNLLQ